MNNTSDSDQAEHGPPQPDGQNVKPDVQVQMLDELRKLRYAQEESRKATAPILSQTITVFLLQALGSILAILFGAFAILAWEAAQQANDYASDANILAKSAYSIATVANSLAASGIAEAQAQNRLALAGYCNSNTDAACLAIQTLAGPSLTALASSYFGFQSSSTSPTTTPTPPSIPSGAPLSTTPLVGTIVGGIVGGVALLSVLYTLSMKTYKARMRRSMDKELGEQGRGTKSA